MNTTVTDGQGEPLTAAWLKANTRIHGWLSFFIFALVVGGLLSLIYPFATYKASDYSGSALLGMTDITLGVVLAVVAAWSVISLCRRSPAAIFWAKYYTILVLLSNGLLLWFGAETLEGDGFGGTKMTVRGFVWAIVWFFYLTFSRQVQEVIPKSYRHAGLRTWCCAGLLLLVPVAFAVVGVVDVAVNYHDHVEISQSELAEDELTDGHVVFDRLQGWFFGMAKTEGINVCSFTNDQELVITLVSVLDADDSRENFVQATVGWANADFEKLVHRIVRDDSNKVNGHTCHYRIVQYDQEDAASIFWHFACLFDQESGKAVCVNGYFLNKDVPEFTKLIQSVRFKK